jgi:hypothetical protein
MLLSLLWQRVLFAAALLRRCVAHCRSTAASAPPTPPPPKHHHHQNCLQEPSGFDTKCQILAQEHNMILWIFWWIAIVALKLLSLLEHTNRDGGQISFCDAY